MDLELRLSSQLLPHGHLIHFYYTNIDYSGFKVAETACALVHPRHVLGVMKCSSSFTKEVVMLHVFCHVLMPI